MNTRRHCVLFTNTPHASSVHSSLCVNTGPALSFALAVVSYVTSHAFHNSCWTATTQQRSKTSAPDVDTGQLVFFQPFHPVTGTLRESFATEVMSVFTRQPIHSTSPASVPTLPTTGNLHQPASATVLLTSLSMSTKRRLTIAFRTSDKITPHTLTTTPLQTFFLSYEFRSLFEKHANLHQFSVLCQIHRIWQSTTTIFQPDSFVEHNPLKHHNTHILRTMENPYICGRY